MQKFFLFLHVFPFMKILLEICTDSYQSALIAQKNGADRIELCSGLSEGGLTPSLGLIQSVIQTLTIPVHVLIRSRPGNFCYTESEIQIMLHDIDYCKQSGATGIVIGALLSDGSIDLQTCERLSARSQPLQLTFHRAFDLTPAPFEAIDQIKKMGFNRILTSGHNASAEIGLRKITQLIRYAGEEMIIMPGAGINEHNVKRIAKISKAKELHMSLRSAKPELNTIESLSKQKNIMHINGEHLLRVRRLLDT